MESSSEGEIKRKKACAAKIPRPKIRLSHTQNLGQDVPFFLLRGLIRVIDIFPHARPLHHSSVAHSPSPVSPQVLDGVFDVSTKILPSFSSNAPP